MLLLLAFYSLSHGLLCCHAVAAGQVADFGKKQTGLDQYAIARFAEALEVVPRTIAENSGLPASEVLARLYAAHTAGQVGGDVAACV
jgi:T-complex protein 1 subunit theta